MKIFVSRVFLTVAVSMVLLNASEFVYAKSSITPEKPATAHSNIAPTNDGRVRFVPDSLFAVDFVSESVGWVAGYYGTMLKTEDGGEHWRRQSLGLTDVIRRIDFIDNEVGFAVTSRGKILRTVDGGDNWDVLHVEAGINLRDIYCRNAQEVWVVGHEATILYTSDGGATWQTQKLTGFQGRDLPRLNGVTRFDDGRLILVGEFGVIASSIDNGRNWKVHKVSDGTATFTSVDTWKTTALVPALGGKLATVKFQDRDSVVSSQSTPREIVPNITVTHSGTPEHLFDLKLDKNGNGLIVGQGGMIQVESGKPISELIPLENKPGFLWYGGISKASASGAFIVVGASGAVLKTDAKLEGEKLVRW